jgi:hypothetical protein
MACPNCGGFEHERFRFVAIEFDVAKANQLIAGRETRVVPEKFLRGMGLPLEPEKCLNCGDPVFRCTCGHTEHHLSVVHINEEHLAHIPEPEKPGVIATILWKKSNGGPEYSAILIDGNHRAVRSFREGREFRAVMLTPQESWDILLDQVGTVQNPNTKAGKAKLAKLGWNNG